MSRAGQRVPPQCGWRAALSTWPRPQSRCAVAPPAAPGCRAGSVWSAGSGKRGLVGVGAHPGDCCGDGSQCSARASLPTRPKGHGPRRTVVGRRSAPAESAARSAARPRPLDGVVPAGRRAARPPLARLPGIHVKVTRAWPHVRAGTGPDYAACTEHWPDARTGATVTCVSAFDDRLQPLPDIGDLLREADRDPIAVVGREPVQAEASAQRRYLTMP
jgi:hypothetical protein